MATHLGFMPTESKKFTWLMLFPWEWFGHKVTFTAVRSSNLLICSLFCFFARNQGAQNFWSWKMITRSFGGLDFPSKYHYLGISFGELNGVSVILTYLNESLIGKISTRVSFFPRPRPLKEVRGLRSLKWDTELSWRVVNFSETPNLSRPLTIKKLF